MYKFRISILILICMLFVFPGCQKYQGFDFTIEKIETDFGSVKAKLHGTKKDWVFYAKHDSPYNLLLRFDFNDNKTEKIKIKTLTLTDSTTEKLIFEKKDIDHSVENNDTDHTYVEITKIPLKYKELKLNLKFVLEQNNIVSEYELNFTFLKDFKSFWQTLLAV